MQTPAQTMMPEEIYRSLVGAGILAPSADNGQPWKFRRQDEGLALYLDPDQLGMFFDADLAATRISCGAVLENIRLRASQLGFDATVRINEGPMVAGQPVATVTLKPGTGQADPLAHALEIRATHRGLYHFHKQIPNDVLDRVAQSLVGKASGVSLAWVKDATARKTIIQTATGADLVRYTHPVIHRDFHHKLRFGHQADVARDGLAADTLGVERFLVPFLRLLAPWPLARFLNALGMHHFMAWRGCTLPMSTAPCLGVMWAETNTSQYDLGWALQRVWLAANQAGLAYQPLGALPLLLLRMRYQGGEGLTMTQRQRLEELDRSWRSVVGVSEQGPMLLMLFRIGYPRQAATRSRRRPLDSFLLPEPPSG